MTASGRPARTSEAEASRERIRARGRGRAQPQTTSFARLRNPVLAGAGAALVLRVIYLLEASDNPFWRELGLDLRIYHEWAQAIARGQSPSGPFLQAPLFPYLLSISYRMLGPDPVRALWFQLAPAALTAGVVAWAAGRWRGPRAAWIAGLLTAFYAPAIFYTGVLLPPTWTLFLSAVVLALGMEMHARSTRLPLAALAGIAAGLLTLAQPVAIALAFPLLLFPLRGAPGWRAALLIGLSLPLAVTFLYNGSRGAWTPIAVNGGINLYIGNGPEANGGYAPPLGMEENRDILGIEIARQRSGSEVETFSAAEADRFWRKEAISSMVSDPARTAALFGRKLLLFFGQYEVPQIESFAFERRYSALLRTPLPGMALLTALAVLGILLHAGDRVGRWLALSAACFALAAAVFFVTARFRLAIAPWLILLASAALVRVYDAARERRWERRAVVTVAAAAVLFVLLSANLLGIDAQAARGQYAYRQGVLAEGAGRIEEAILHYREALADDPNLAKANVNLGTLLARQGKVAEALPYLEAGARLDPASGTALQNLGQAYQVSGRTEDALSQFQKAVLAQPDLVSARESLAYLRYASGDIKEARQNLQTILFQAPKGTPPSLRAGTLLAIMDERTDLIGQLRREGRIGEVDPQWWNHPQLLEADLALAQRRLEDARRGYAAASLEPAVAPYAQNILEQMTENLGAP